MYAVRLPKMFCQNIKFYDAFSVISPLLKKKAMLATGVIAAYRAMDTLIMVGVSLLYLRFQMRMPTRVA